MAIPSYVTVCGWNVYITNRGQAKRYRICHNTDHMGKDCPISRNRDQPENMDVPDQESQKEIESENTAETTSNDRVMEKVTIEDCLIPTSVEPGVQQDVQDLETRGQAWADSPEENPFEVGSEKPQDDSSSEPATPRSVQRQIFGTDTEISDDEPPISQSIWGDNITDRPSKPEIKDPVVYCSLCRDNSHPEEGCTASIIKKANKKALSTGDSKKTGKGKITCRKFKSDLDLVVMRGRNTDSVQYILELK